MSAVIVPAYAAMPAATAVPAFATMPTPTPSMATLAAMFSRGRTSHCDGQRRRRGDDEQP